MRQGGTELRIGEGPKSMRPRRAGAPSGRLSKRRFCLGLDIVSTQYFDAGGRIL